MKNLVQAAYDISEIKSMVESISWVNMNAIVNTLQNGWLILWQYHSVFTGRIEAGKLTWLNQHSPESDDNHLVRIRAFNNEKEFHFWRSGNTIKGRLRSDNVKGNMIEAVDTDMVLRGVIAEPVKSHSIDLARGTLSLQTRHYIDYHTSTGQAGYVDTRFVQIRVFNHNN